MEKALYWCVCVCVCCLRFVTFPFAFIPFRDVSFRLLRSVSCLTGFGLLHVSHFSVFRMLRFGVTSCFVCFHPIFILGSKHGSDWDRIRPGMSDLIRIQVDFSSISRHLILGSEWFDLDWVSEWSDWLGFGFISSVSCHFTLAPVVSLSGREWFDWGSNCFVRCIQFHL